jgi:hypothetical protein
MFTDERRCNIWDQIRQQELQGFGKILTPALMAEAAQAAEVEVGNNPLNWANMVWLGLAAALNKGQNFADILVLAFKVLEDAAGWKPFSTAKKRKRKGKRRTSKYDPHGGTQMFVSEEAFVQARQKMPMAYWMWLILLLAEHFQSRHPQSVRWKHFRLLALDGTEIAMPYWKTLAKAFGASRNGRRRRRPQARMVMLAFPQVRMPWRYELAPRSCHEQTVAARLLEHLQPDDLLLMDRGFWNFRMFWKIQSRHAFFGIRLRRGMKLKTTRALCQNDSLVEWRPVKKSKKKNHVLQDMPGLPKSMTLRVIRYKIRGFRPSAVVTNVLDPKVISQEDWVRMATENEEGRVLEPGLYHRRWEIETMFCELKVRQGMERSLRSRSAEGIAFEVAGHMLLYSITRWLIFEAAQTHRVSPLRISFTHASRELNNMRQTLLLADPQRIRRVLLPRLLRRIAQHLVPLRPGRHYPRPSDKYKKKKYRQSAKLLTKQT